MSRKKTVSKLAVGITLLISRIENPTGIRMEIDNALLTALEFTVDVSGSRNLAFALRLRVTHLLQPIQD